MRRLWWIARGAWYMRRVSGWWKPKDLRFCWHIADVCYDGAVEADGDPGCPRDAIDEELTYWTE